MTVLLFLSGVMVLARTIRFMRAPLLVALAAEFHTSAAMAGQCARGRLTDNPATVKPHGDDEPPFSQTECLWTAGEAEAGCIRTNLTICENGGSSSPWGLT